MRLLRSRVCTQTPPPPPPGERERVLRGRREEEEGGEERVSASWRHGKWKEVRYGGENGS